MLCGKTKSYKFGGVEDFCGDIESKEQIDALILEQDEDNIGWLNRFLAFVVEKDELLLKNYALLPNMNGTFLKKDADGFKQAEHISQAVLDILEKLGGDMKPLLLHECITAVGLDAKFNSTSYSARINNLIKGIIDKPSSELSDDAKLLKFMPLASISITDGSKYEEQFITRRTKLHMITTQLFGMRNTHLTIDNSLNKVAWDVMDSWLTNHIIMTIESKKSLSCLPIGLNAKWICDVIKNLGISLSDLNKHAILPNQYGDFCLSNTLFIDGGLPFALKNEVFDKIRLPYKAILLDTDIDLKSIGLTATKNISDFASDLLNAMSWTQNYQESNPYSSYGHYRKFDEEILRYVSQYLIQILPSSGDSLTHSIQIGLRNIARFFLGEKYNGTEVEIEYYDSKLWNQVNEFVCRDIISFIEEQSNISKITQLLGTTEDAIFDNLNILYQYIEKKNLPLTNKSIYPNQAGYFVHKETLFMESEPIASVLKDIIDLVVEEKRSFYNILIDLRCKANIPRQKSCADSYAIIDDTIKALYENPNNWENEKFRKATRLLIDEWGDKHPNLFDQNHFPKTWPIRDSISMNVVWTKNERQQLQILKNNLDESQLMELVAHVDELRELSYKNQELTDEILRLRKEIENLKSDNGANVDSDEDEAAKKIMYEAQLEAQKKLIESRPDWEFPKDYGQCDENGVPCCFSTETVKDENGIDLPIVLKSYKSRLRPFKINPTEWESVVKDGAKLLVYTSVNGVLDIVEISQEDLVMNQSNISITFNSENLDREQFSDRVTAFAETLHYFKELHFNFDRFHVKENAVSVRNIFSKRAGVQDTLSEKDI